MTVAEKWQHLTQNRRNSPGRRAAHAQESLEVLGVAELEPAAGAQRVEDQRAGLQRIIQGLPQRLGRQAEQPLKVFAGYAGWGAAQLELEVEQGIWRAAPATSPLSSALVALVLPHPGQCHPVA